MSTRQFGEPVKRNEDARLLAGRAQFVDDVQLPEMLHAAFVRSPYAHARLKSIDVAPALAHEGVVAVYTAADLGAYWRPGPVIVPPPPVAGAVFNERTQVPLIRDKARHVGEGGRQVRRMYLATVRAATSWACRSRPPPSSLLS